MRTYRTRIIITVNEELFNYYYITFCFYKLIIVLHIYICNKNSNSTQNFHYFYKMVTKKQPKTGCPHIYFPQLHTICSLHFFLFVVSTSCINQWFRWRGQVFSHTAGWSPWPDWKWRMSGKRWWSRRNEHPSVRPVP